MRKLTVAVLLCSFLLGCAGGGGALDPADESAELFGQAVAANQAGQFGESEGLLEDVVSRLAATPSAAKAEALLGEVRSASEAKALEAVRNVIEAQVNFISLNRRYALTLGELVQELTLDEDPSLADSGYQIRMRGSPNADNYSLTAEPSIETVAKRSFFADSTGTIRWELGQPATADSPELEEATSEVDED